MRALAELAAAGHRPGHLPVPAGLGHHPARRHRRAEAAPHHGHRRARRGVPVHLPRPAPRPRRPRTRCPASCTARTPPGRAWWPGTGGRRTTTTPSPSPPPAPGSPTWPSWRSCATLYQGTECWVIDPEDEYARLAAGTGGAYLHLGAAGVRLNPFDLPAPPGPGRAPDALTRRALFLHTVVGGPARRPARPGGAGRAGPGDHGRLPPRRDHRRPAHLGPARPAAARTWPPRCAPTAPTRP